MQKAVTNYRDYASSTELLQFAFEHEEFQLVANVVDDCLRQGDTATAQQILQASDAEMQYLVETAQSIGPCDLQYVL